MTQIYEIISLIHPETVYVGKHKGDIFKDNYWGSGTVIKNYVDKYGKENFERRICNTISNYKNITCINASCWATQSQDQERRGIIPEPSRVVAVNLKTRDIKIMNFGK